MSIIYPLPVPTTSSIVTLQTAYDALDGNTIELVNNRGFYINRPLGEDTADIVLEANKPSYFDVRSELTVSAIVLRLEGDNGVQIDSPLGWSVEIGTNTAEDISIGQTTGTYHDVNVRASHLGAINLESSGTINVRTLNVSMGIPSEAIIDAPASFFYMGGFTSSSILNYGKLYDLGGPTGNYYNDLENIFILHNGTDTSYELNINSISLEYNVDFLRAYTADITSSLTGVITTLSGEITTPGFTLRDTYTGTAATGTTASYAYDNLVFVFYSDADIVDSGFDIVWKGNTYTPTYTTIPETITAITGSLISSGSLLSLSSTARSNITVTDERLDIIVTGSRAGGTQALIDVSNYSGVSQFIAQANTYALVQAGASGSYPYYFEADSANKFVALEADNVSGTIYVGGTGHSSAINIGTSGTRNITIGSVSSSMLIVNPVISGSLIASGTINTLQPNIWNKPQIGYISTLASVSNTASVDLSLSNNFIFNITETTLLKNPTSASNGQSGIITIIQPTSSNYSLTYDTFWKFPSGSVKSLTATNGAIDALAYYVASGSFAICNLLGNIT